MSTSYNLTTNATVAPLALGTTNATEATVPDDFIALAHKNKGGSIGGGGVEARLGVTMQNLGQDEGTSTVSMSFSALTWSLILLVVLVPLILQPILFLFARTSDEDVSRISGDEESCPQGEMQELKNLKKHMCLWPTVRNTDPFLYDAANLSDKGDIVQVDQAEEPFYYLKAEYSLCSTTNGHLYHLPSGLLFVPIHDYIFHRQYRLYVNILTGEMNTPQPNHVYNDVTNKLYERFLAIGYNLRTGSFYLPEQPVVPPNQPSVAKIRRAAPEVLHENYHEMYSNLLEERRTLAGTKVMHQPEEAPPKSTTPEA